MYWLFREMADVAAAIDIAGVRVEGFEQEREMETHVDDPVASVVSGYGEMGSL